MKSMILVLSILVLAGCATQAHVSDRKTATREVAQKFSAGADQVYGRVMVENVSSKQIYITFDKEPAKRVFEFLKVDEKSETSQELVIKSKSTTTFFCRQISNTTNKADETYTCSVDLQPNGTRVPPGD
jgi:hypothetical protein